MFSYSELPLVAPQRALILLMHHFLHIATALAPDNYNVIKATLKAHPEQTKRTEIAQEAIFSS